MSQRKKEQVFSLQDIIKKGDWLDVKEKEGAFRLAKVIYIEDKQISIRFEDFDQYRRDCKLYIQSSRIAPLRRYTVGYTGPKYPNRDLNIDIVRFPDVMKKMNDILQNQQQNAYELTQFLRGKVYMMIEHILSFPPDLLNKLDLKELVGFLDNYIRWSIQFNKKCLKIAQAYFQQFLINKQSYLTSPQIAELAALAQVYYCIQLILAIKGELRNKLYKVLQDKEARFRTLLIQNNGLDIIQKTFQYKDSNGRGFPAIIRIGALVILNSCKVKFNFPQFDVRDHTELPKIFPSMLELYPSERLQNDIICYSLKLMSGQNNFETRLKGLNQLKSNLESVRSRDTDNIQFKKISQDRFLLLLKQSKLFQTLMNKKTFNPQIFKRSVPLLKFLSEKKAFGVSQIKHIFLLAEDRHESDKRLIYDTVSQVAAFSPIDILDNLWSELLKLPLDQPTIDLLQNFTIKAVHNIGSQSSIFDLFRKRRSSPKYDLYAVNHFWNQIQDNSKITDVSIIQSLLGSLKTMFTHSSFSYARDNYMQQCINNLKKKFSVGPSLRLLIDIIMTYNADSYLLGGDSRHQVIQRLDKKHKLLDVFFNALKSGDYGKLGYTLCIQYLFEFLQLFNESLKTSLKINQITSLWKAEYSLTPMLAFLKKHKLSKYNEKYQYQEKYYKKLSDNLIRQLFENIFLKPKMMNEYNLTDELFETVDQLFLSMHISQKNIKFKEKTLIRIANTSKPLQGINFFYNLIYFNNSSSQIISKSIKRYVGLHTRTVEPETQELMRLWKGFSVKIIGNIQMQPHKANQIIPILHEFFVSIQGLLIRPNQVDKSLGTITAYYKDQQIIVELSRQSSLFKLHEILRTKVPQIKYFNLGLIEGEKVITFAEEEDFSVKSLQSKNNSVKIIQVHKHHFYQSLQTFKSLTSRSKIYDTLLQLLNNSNVNQDLVWNVLQVLPRNKILVEKLNNSKESEKQWQHFFSDKVQLLVYKLKLIRELILNEQWLANFTSGKGIKFLIQRILKSNNKNSQKQMKCLLLLVNTLLKCIDSKFSKQTLHALDKSLMVSRFSDIIFYIIVDKSLKYSNQLLTSILEITIKLLKTEPELGKILSNFKVFYQQLAMKGINIEGQSEKFIYLFNQLFRDFAPEQQKVQVIMSLLNVLKDSDMLTTKFFDLLINCFNGLKNQDFLQKSEAATQIIKQYCSKIFKNDVNSKANLDLDRLLYGAFKLKSLLISKSSYNQSEKGLLDELITSYLLPIKGSVKFQLQISLHEYYNLLVILISRNPQFCQIIFERLTAKFKLYEQSSIKYDWGVELEKQPRKKFCGLRNLRATCYINSLVQQLYMIKPFRQAIIRQQSQNYKANPKQNQILQFQKVLTYLKESKKGSYNPRQFCEAFKDFDGNPIDVSIQGDVDQFYNALMQKLQTFLKVNNDTRVINNVFAGQLSNQLICQANHKSQRLQHYTSIGLNIKNKSSLEEALQGYVQGQILQGDNAYFCQQCKQKVKTVKRICIQTLPNVLIVVLKRFQFNYDLMRKYKVNDYCSFPFDLNMKKYTSQHLNDSKNFEPEEYYDFKLRGVIVHYGTSDAGHYYSYIKDGQEWFEFNDELVTPFNPSSIQVQAFGGTETFGQDLEYKTQRCKNAYMLFYERSSCFDTNQKQTQKMLEYPLTSPQHQKLHNLVVSDNSSYQFMSIVYEINFLNFISELIISTTPQASKLVILVFHNIILKHRHKQDFIMGLGTKIQQILKKNAEIANWYINQFNNHIIKQYLLEGSQSTRYIVTGLLYSAIDCVGVIGKNSILMFMSFIQRKGMTPYARIFTAISNNPENKQFLEQNKYPERVIDIIKNQNPQYKPITVEDWATELIQNPLPQRVIQKSTKYSALIESLQNFNVSTESIQLILAQMTAQASIQTIAKMATKNVKTNQDATKIIEIIESNIAKGDQRQIKNYSLWWKQLISKCPTEKVVSQIVQSHFRCFQIFYKYYIPFQTLLRALFKLCLFPIYKDQIQKQLINSPTAAKIIDSWISKCGNAYHLIVTEEWNTYKKKLSGKSDTLSPSQYRQKKQEYQSTWKTITAKGEVKQNTSKGITTNQEFLQGGEQKYILYPKISTQKIKAKIQNQLGFLYQVTLEKGISKFYWYMGDTDELQFQSYL